MVSTIRSQRNRLGLLILLAIFSTTSPAIASNHYQEPWPTPLILLFVIVIFLIGASIGLSSAIILLGTIFPGNGRSEVE